MFWKRAPQSSTWVCRDSKQLLALITQRQDGKYEAFHADDVVVFHRFEDAKSWCETEVMARLAP